MDTYTQIAALLAAMHPAAQSGIPHAERFSTRFATALEEHLSQPLPSTPPPISDFPLRDILQTATALREIAADLGIRDDFDRAMDDVYQELYAAERRRRWGDRFAA